MANTWTGAFLPHRRGLGTDLAAGARRCRAGHPLSGAVFEVAGVFFEMAGVFFEVAGVFFDA
jgi:hypothetical protein